MNIRHHFGFTQSTYTTPTVVRAVYSAGVFTSRTVLDVVDMLLLLFLLLLCFFLLTWKYGSKMTLVVTKWTPEQAGTFLTLAGNLRSPALCVRMLMAIAFAGHLLIAFTCSLRSLLIAFSCSLSSPAYSVHRLIAFT
jgi:hypothetical protein